jgi:glutathione peroxidase-family protein
MKTIKTKIDDEMFEYISKNYASVYKFLQAAAREKIERDQNKSDFEKLFVSVVDAIGERIENLEKEQAKSNLIAREKLAIIAEALEKNGR